MVTQVCAKSNYDWLRIDEALGYFRQYDSNKNNMNKATPACNKVCQRCKRVSWIILSL